MEAPFSKIPALPAVAGLSAGIFAYVSLGLSLWWSLVLIVAGLAAAFVRRHQWSAFVLCFTALGLLLAGLRESPGPPETLVGEEVIGEGTIAEITERDLTCEYIVDVDRIALDNDSTMTACCFRISLSCTDFQKLYEPGQRIAFRGVLEGLEAQPDVPDKTDYGRYLYIKGCTAQMAAFLEVKPIGEPTSCFGRLSLKVRHNLSDAVVRTGTDPGTASFMLAVLLGDDTLLSDSLEEDFRLSGIAHILALSGLHLTILIGLVTMLLSFLRLARRGHDLLLIMLMLISLGYAAITGFSPSVSRAAVMMVVFLGSRLIQDCPLPYNSLCVTVFIWLLINPLWLYSPGFQLSTVTVWGLIWLNGRVRELNIRSAAVKNIILLVAVPAVCVLFSGVLIVAYFHRLPLWFMVTSIAGSLLIVPFIAIGALLLLAALMGIALPPVAAVENLLYEAMRSLAESFGEASWAVVDGIYPTTLQYILLVLTVLAVICTLHYRRVSFMLAASLCLTGCILSEVLEAPSRGHELYLTRDKSPMRVLVRSDEQAYLLLPSAVADTALCRETFDRALNDYAAYLGRRDINKLEMPSDNFECPGFSMHKNMLTAGGRTFYFYSGGNVDSLTVRPDYLVVCGRFKGDVVSIARNFAPGEVLLGGDINRTRRRRYVRELRHAGFIARDLAESGFAMNF